MIILQTDRPDQELMDAIRHEAWNINDRVVVSDFPSDSLHAAPRWQVGFNERLGRAVVVDRSTQRGAVCVKAASVAEAVRTAEMLGDD